MPDIAQFDDREKWLEACIPAMVGEGRGEEQAVAACSSMWADKMDAAKYRASLLAVKVAGDWELDVLAVPFHIRDSDGQWFDEHTDIMPDTFSTPLVVYQHGVAQGAKGLQDRPVILGKSLPGTLKKMTDGWHVRILLDKAVKYAKDIMEAAKHGAVAVSSGSIAHLARLDIGGKLIQYEKSRPGRIAVWALGEISLWERGNGNMKPANPFAVALPVMKAMYREAGLPFPELKDTGGGVDAEKVRRRARVVEMEKAKAKQILRRYKNG